MSKVYEEKETVVFVGGIGTKAGSALCGGCTKAWYDANFTQLSDIMGANGAPLVTLVACNYDHTGGAGGEREIRKADAGEFANAQPGMFALILGTNITGDYYEITAVDPAGNYVLVSGIAAAGDNNDTQIYIGGAFEKLQAALDNTVATNYTVRIFDNKNELISTAIDFDIAGGSIANNSQCIVEGFNTNIGDMNRGGAYYQSPLDCLKNGINADKCISLNRQAGASDVITINNFNGLVLKNFYLHNTNQAANNNCVEFVNNPDYITFINCRFDDAYKAFDGNVYGCCADGCYVGNDFAYAYISSGTWYAGVLDNCVFNGEGKYGNCIIDCVVFKDCLFYKSIYGLYVEFLNTIINCVFYGQTFSCMRFSSGSFGTIQGYNNIFMPAAAADYVVYMNGAVGSVCVETLLRSCIWTVADVAVTNHVNHNGNNSQLGDYIAKDPLFEDATNFKFRLQPKSPVLNKGKWSPGTPGNDGVSTIGMWQRQSFLEEFD